MARYRDEATEIAHLEPPEPRWFGPGGSHSRQGPLHVWTLGQIDRCTVCGLTRWVGHTWHREMGHVYQLRNGQLRVGAEPCCKAKKARGR